MKKIAISLVALCACFMVSCGNAEIDKINKLVEAATEQTKAAKTTQEVSDIATKLQKEMEKITADAGEKVSFGKSAEKSLEKYQAAAKAKLAEFGIELK